MIEISRTELARNTRDIVDQVHHGQPIVVKSYGKDQIILLDATDYRLLKAVANYALVSQSDTDADSVDEVVRLYLQDQISLAKAAELLDVSRYELMERFERLAIPLRIGPETLEDAQNEIAAAKNVK